MADACRKPTDSINFVIAHDGFTLYDLVSYNEKHNDQNGEGNRCVSSMEHSVMVCTGCLSSIRRVVPMTLADVRKRQGVSKAV